MEDHLSADQIAQLRKKHESFIEQRDQIVENLRQGGKEAVEGSFNLTSSSALLQYSFRTYSWSGTITRTLHTRRRRISSTE
jgi:hypothetical protein